MIAFRIFQFNESVIERVEGHILLTCNVIGYFFFSATFPTKHKSDRWKNPRHNSFIHMEHGKRYQKQCKPSWKLCMGKELGDQIKCYISNVFAFESIQKKLPNFLNPYSTSRGVVIFIVYQAWSAVFPSPVTDCLLYEIVLWYLYLNDYCLFYQRCKYKETFKLFTHRTLT